MNIVTSKGHRNRLRERFAKTGLDAFQDYEILELILMYCIPRKDVKPIAKGLLKRFKKLSTVLETPAERLVDVDGVGERTALFLNLLHQTGVYCMKDALIGSLAMESFEDVICYCRQSLGGLKYEVFHVLFFSISGKMLASEDMHEGALTQSVVYPRKIIERAFYHNASILVLVHNHPGGSLVPSSADLDITDKISKVGGELDISVYDHIIVADGGFFSFKDSNLI